MARERDTKQLGFVIGHLWSTLIDRSGFHRLGPPDRAEIDLGKVERNHWDRPGASLQVSANEDEERRSVDRVQWVTKNEAAPATTKNWPIRVAMAPNRPRRTKPAHRAVAAPERRLRSPEGRGRQTSGRGRRRYKGRNCGAPSNVQEACRRYRVGRRSILPPQRSTRRRRRSKKRCVSSR